MTSPCNPDITSCLNSFRRSSLPLNDTTAIRHSGGGFNNLAYSTKEIPMCVPSLYKLLTSCIEAVATEVLTMYGHITYNYGSNYY